MRFREVERNIEKEKLNKKKKKRDLKRSNQKQILRLMRREPLFIVYLLLKESLNELSSFCFSLKLHISL